jgi:hypothetical protein
MQINYPDNYRGITILSCYGKLLTAVFNNRLNCYLEDMNVLCEEQVGFRQNYGTYDHIFNLKCLIDLHLQCTFKMKSVPHDLLFFNNFIA